MIEEREGGCVVAVRAQPGAKRNGVLGIRNGRLRVAVQAPPDKGRANAAIVEVLAEFFGIRRSQIELVAGPTSQEKRFFLRGVAIDQATRKLAEMPSG